jgi:hypothetical protein
MLGFYDAAAAQASLQSTGSGRACGLGHAGLLVRSLSRVGAAVEVFLSMSRSSSWVRQVRLPLLNLESRNTWPECAVCASRLQLSWLDFWNLHSKDRVLSKSTCWDKPRIYA